MSSDDEMYAENLNMDIVLKVFHNGVEVYFEVYDRQGEEWASGSAPTFEDAMSAAVSYVHAEWPRSMFK